MWMHLRMIPIIREVLYAFQIPNSKFLINYVSP
jgi:hypothetical protein